MTTLMQYQLISGTLPNDFAKALATSTAAGWKPILLTSAAPNPTIPQGEVVVVAIMEKLA